MDKANSCSRLGQNRYIDEASEYRLRSRKPLNSRSLSYRSRANGILGSLVLLANLLMLGRLHLQSTLLGFAGSLAAAISICPRAEYRLCRMVCHCLDFGNRCAHCTIVLSFTFHTLISFSCLEFVLVEGLCA